MSVSHTDDSGNVRVDFVWGNVPMQPNDDRQDMQTHSAGSENVGWSGTDLYYSDTLQYSDYTVELNNLEYKVPAANHINVDLGYSNFPAFIPNYEGDEDPGYEAVVPDLIRKTISQAEYIVDGLNLNLFTASHNPEIQYVVSDGTTVRVYAYDPNAYGDSPLVGLKSGDKVWVDSSYGSFPDLVTITNVSDNLEYNDQSYIEFKVESDPALDDYASGTIWPGPDLEDVITVQRFWNQAGDIRDEWTNVHVRYLGY